jgi:heparan-alpha-glucosaminide N-acetyltransferase
MSYSLRSNPPSEPPRSPRTPIDFIRDAVRRAPSERLISLDAYRGFVMLAMVSGGLGLAKIAKEHYPDNPVWTTLGYQAEHVEWGGCSFWDLIQPSFMFIVGVAMPFSYAQRRQTGAPWWKLALHAFIRSLVLILLGVMLYSEGSLDKHPQTNWIFKNVLAQIGLGYFFVFLLLEFRWFWQFLAAIAILFATWFAFHQYPVMTPEQVQEKRIEGHWQYYTGDAAHWNKNTNFAAEADRVFLNKFPRKEIYRFDDGYQTLNFVPSMATMLFGVVAGVLLRGMWTMAAKFWTLLAWGISFLAVGLALDHTLWPNWFPNFSAGLPKITDPTPTIDAGFGRPFTDRTWTVCPVVKKIWTPTWTIFSTGWTLILLAAFYGVIDGIGWKKWAFPFVVVGLNSITIYLLSNMTGGWITTNLKRHFGSEWLSGPFEPMKTRIAVMVVLWLFLYWLYRQRVFLKI